MIVRKKCTKDYWLGSLVEPIRGGACKTHESCQDLTMCYDDLLILYASFYLSRLNIESENYSLETQREIDHRKKETKGWHHQPR